LQDNECSDISENECCGDYDMKVKISPNSQQSFTSNKEDNVCDSSDMQPGTWTKLGTECPCSPFDGKSGLNVDLEDPDYLLEYLKLLIHVKLLN
jgi:hypothetical protein